MNTYYPKFLSNFSYLIKMKFVFLYTLILCASNLALGQAGQCLAGGCTTGVSFGATQSTTSTVFVNSVAGTFAGEYNTYNVTTGQQYEWSLCGADGATNPTGDTQLSLRRNDNNNAICYSDDLCGSQAKILWTATFTGVVRVYVHQYNCVTNSNSHTVRWRCISCAPACAGTLVSLNMFDSFGDGWNGAQLTITGNNATSFGPYTIASGSSGTQTICLPSDCYSIGVTGGTFPGEVSWSITAGATTYASGGAPYNQSNVFSVGAGVCSTPPPCIANPTAPTNGQTGVSTSPTLSWPTSAGATGYNVYFGTTNPPNTLVSSNQAGTTYNTGALSQQTTYYWRIVPLNANGTAIGCANWSFTTACSGTTVSLNMFDSFGDGWNGAQLTITGNNATSFGPYTIASGSSGTQTICLPSDCYSIGVTGGTFPGEVSWSITAGATTYASGGAPYNQSNVFSVGAGVCLPGCLANPTAPTNGQVGVSTSPTLSWPASPNATGYNVYFGTTNPPLTLVAANNPGTVYAPPVLNGTTTYYWSVEPVNANGTATGCAIWSFTTTAPPPANDLCGNAEVIFSSCGSTYTSTGTTQFATNTGNGPTCTTAASTSNAVWYTFTGIGNNVTASLCGSAFNTKIFVYSGTCGAFTCTAGNDDFCGTQSEVTFNTVSGVQYYILVAGSGSNNGAYTLNVTFQGVPIVGVSAGNDVTICNGQSTNLNGLPNSTVAPPPISGFTSTFAPANWTFTTNNSDGDVITTGAPNSIYISSGDNGSGTEGWTNFNIVVPNDGVISWNWAYETYDAFNSPFWDRPMYAIDGVYALMTGFNTGGATIQSGTTSVNVLAGQTFTLSMYCVDNVLNIGEVIVSNFLYVPNGSSYNYIWSPALGLSSTNTQNTVASPTTTTTYTLTVTNTLGGCSGTDDVTVTVVPLNTIAAGINRTTCINTAITPITLATTGATGATITGLPAGVTGSWSGNVVTISGTPTTTVGSPFTYTVTTTGGCPPASTTGTITVNPQNTIAAGINRTTCINTAITPITLATTGATGATITGLPAGVTGSWSGNVVTISGTPTTSVGSPFTYTVTTTGGCPPATTTGTIIVTPANTVAAASSTPTLCVNTALVNITHATTGATGIGAAVNLPAGVSASWAGNVITISGTPTASGTFNYSIPLTGGCGTVSATGTIIVTPANTVAVASSTPTLCINTALVNITHATTGATGIGAAVNLPAGVSAAWAGNVITISGTPSVSGTFNYSIPLTGGCGTVSATGTIIVTPPVIVNAGLPQIVCANTPTVSLSGSVTNALGGIWSGGTGSFSPNNTSLNVLYNPTISDIISGSVNLTLTSTGNGFCLPESSNVLISFIPVNTVAAGTSQTVCINSPITTITLATFGATGATVTGLPVGVTGTWAANVVTISGTPTVSGTFTYTVNTTGGCPPATTTGTITVTPANTVGAASSSPTLCINTAMTNITHATTGATGIGAATGLPAGVSAAWAGNVITISGTPTASGTFNYSIPLTGGCGTVSATGTIIVTPANTVAAASSTPTLCVNTALVNITHATTGATGIGAAVNLPAGVSAAWAGNVITISGTPSVSGTFNYSIPLTGGCGTVSATGTITVTPANTVAAASSTPTLCINIALVNITHATTGATGIGAAVNLPAGVSAAWAGNVITISGTPTASGTFNYSIPLTGGCGTVSATGTITVTATNTIAGGANITSCINTAITTFTMATTGATGATFAGLPAGVTGSWAADVATISGTPTVSGTFNYTVTTTGGCPPASTSGTITINPVHTITAGANQDICINNAMTNITMTIGGGATGATVTGLPAGVVANVAGTTLTISGTPTASGVFNYSVVTTGNACTTASANGTLTIDNSSVAPTGISGPTTICLGGGAPLSVVGGSLGTGANWQWFTGSCGGTLIGTGATITVQPTAKYDLLCKCLSKWNGYLSGNCLCQYNGYIASSRKYLESK
jgi:hypothetical protein